MLLLTHADTDAVTFARALNDADAKRNKVVPLQHVSSAEQLLAIADGSQGNTVYVCRLLGNISDVPGLPELIKRLSANRSPLVVLSGTGERRPEHEAISTVSREIVDAVWMYLNIGGVENMRRLVAYLSHAVFASDVEWQPPVALPEVGIYHPRLNQPVTAADDWRAVATPGRKAIGINFYRAHWLSGNTAFIDSLIAAFDERNIDAIAVFVPSGRLTENGIPAALSKFIDADGNVLVEAVVNTTSFSIGDACENTLKKLNVPMVQAISTAMTEEQWGISSRGLNALDTAMNVALPEFDGRIITVPVSVKQDVASDDGSALYKPLEERARRVAGMVEKLVRLREIPNSDKRVAFVFTNASSKASQIGNAVGLDAPQSLLRLLEDMSLRGYSISDVPESSDQLIHELIDRCSYDRTVLTESQCRRAIGAVPEKVYRRWFDELPLPLQEKMISQWGPAPGEAYVHGGKLLIAGIQLGNAVVILQPPRGYGMDPNAIYHQPDLPPTHHYLAVYRWLAEEFKADAIVHVGKHGTLEWLPGKGVGLSASCFPDAFLRDMPMVYPFIINDPGEGAQAKRRSHAVIVDHLPPPLTTADTYGVLAELTELVDEYYRCEALDPTKLTLLRQQIWDLIKEARLDEDLALIMDHDHDDDHDQDDHHNDHDHERDHDDHDHHHDDEHHDDHWNATLNEEGVPISLSEMDSVKVSHLVQEIDGYLCELGMAQIRDGLHILGQVPQDSALVDTLACLLRLPNENVPGLHDALAGHFGLSIADVVDRKGERVRSVDRVARLSDLSGRAIHTNSDVLEALDALGVRLLRELQSADFDSDAIADVVTSVLAGGGDNANLTDVLKFACLELIPRLRKTCLEIDNTLNALDGGFTPPGPSGSPSRGMAHILPTGRNFYSVDPRSVPSAAAWLVGQRLADEVIGRFLDETGRYPESVSISVWGTSAMRTHGDDIAEILYLMGVRPSWQVGSARVAGIEVIPLSELKRPRIDVTTRISGLFRDAFPHLISLIDQAVNAVIDLEEPLESNFIRKHYLEQMEALQASGCANREANIRSRYRVFGSKPGSYGAGILTLMQEQNWSDEKDITEVYLNWGGFAYTASESGAAAREDFSRRLETVEVAVHNQDNREHDIFDSDDYFQFHGGLIAAVRTLSGEQPRAYFGDSHDPARPAVRDLRQETLRVFRSRVVNPKWIESIKRHGYKGALELSATVDYLFGYDATAGVMQDWMYEQVAQNYAIDPAMQEFLQEANPWALKAISERLLEAAKRNMWTAPSPETIEELKRAYMRSEAELEGKSAGATAVRQQV
jgi:cobaltochelatase CobN